jgi:hypothetical protein
MTGYGNIPKWVGPSISSWPKLAVEPPERSPFIVVALSFETPDMTPVPIKDGMVYLLPYSVVSAIMFVRYTTAARSHFLFVDLLTLLDKSTTNLMSSIMPRGPSSAVWRTRLGVC